MKLGWRWLSRIILGTLIMLPGTGCGGEAQSGGEIRGYDLSKKGRQVKLPRSLKEVSGLTASGETRLFAHDDERGVVYQLDAATGSVLKSFTLGRTTVTEDFEGIAAAGAYLYMVTSKGDLFVFREGPDGGRVEYRVLSTPLDRGNDVEGLCFDPATQSLLLACKGSAGAGKKDARAVYAYSLKRQRLESKPRFLLDARALSKGGRGKEFRPSAIERHPVTGTFFILAAQGESLVEISAEGNVLGQARLPRGVHAQPEGLAFLPNGDMLISDEGKKHGTLTRYRWKGR